MFDDLRFAVRRLRHSPGFALVAIATVMLTVGANTAILGVADAVLFRPLPYADAGNVAILQMRSKEGSQSTMTPYANLQAINDSCPSISEVGLLEDGPRVYVDTPDGRVVLPAAEASPNYFEILGVRAAVGRLFTPADRGREGRAAVLSHGAWQQLFGADASIAGRTVTLGATSFDIVGVLPADFIFPSNFGPVTSASRPHIVVLRNPLDGTEKGGTFHPIVRIASGVSWERAQDEINSASQSVVTTPQREGSVPALNPVRSILYSVGRPVMRYLLVASLFVLLLGCANLANLLLVRGRRMMKDTAVRLAMGASRGRLVRPLVFEAAIVGVVGAGLAVLAAWLTFDLLLTQVPGAAYGRAPVGISGRVIAISIALGLLASLAFSLVPAWRSARTDVLALIQRRTAPKRGGARLGRPLVAAQVAIAVAVVFGAAIATRTFVAIATTPLGFSPEGVVRISVGPRNLAEQPNFYRQVVDTLRARPDVIAAAAVGSYPFSRMTPDEGVRLDPNSPMAAGLVHPLPDYCQVIGAAIKRCYAYTWAEVDANPNVAVVSESAARVLFGEGEPLGATFDNGRGRVLRVVGVVEDIRSSWGAAGPPATYAMPEPGRRALTVVARMRNRTEATLRDVRTSLGALNPSVVPTVAWLDEQVRSDPAYQDPRFQTMAFALFAALALGLTALGIFSVMSYIVTTRTREMGVRLAIGASPRSLVSLMIRQSLLPVSIGIAAGLVLATWGGRLAEAQFFKVSAKDPVMLALAALTVVVATLAAAYLPARRATRVNPAEVLRAE